MNDALEILNKDLIKVRYLMENEFELKVGHIKDFIEFPSSSMKDYFYPYLLLASYRLVSKNDNPPYHMAAVIQFISMATDIHKYSNNSLQYSVLIGDYIYAKFFSYLCDYDSLHWLKPLSQVICSIHEGGIERRERENEGIMVDIEILKNEFAKLGEISCEIGGKYANCSNEIIQILKDVGFNISLIKALCSEKTHPAKEKLYCEKAQRKLKLIPKQSVNSEMLTVFNNLILSLDCSAKFLSTKVV